MCVGSNEARCCGWSNRIVAMQREKPRSKICKAKDLIKVKSLELNVEERPKIANFLTFRVQSREIAGFELRCQTKDVSTKGN